MNQKQSINSKNIRPISNSIRNRYSKHSLGMQQGDISIKCNNLKECKELSNVANGLRKSTPPRVNFGGFAVTAGTIGKLIVVAGGCLALYSGYNYINKRWIKGDKIKETNENNDDVPELLKNDEKQPEVVTLNQIGKQDVDELIPLLGDYYYSSDIVFLFSISNKGKTLIGVQNAIDIAKGVKSSIRPTESVPPKHNVIYYNFEMRKAQFKKRYFGKDPNAIYPDNLEIVNCGSTIHNVDELLNDTAARAETLQNDTVIFYDTIKDVCPTFFSNEACRVIGSLRNLIGNVRKKKGIRLTFVLMGQTVKKNYWDSIELEDLSGSFNQIALADSVFALGLTRYGKDVRMLKMLKGRNDGLTDKVDLLRIVDNPYLHVEYIDSVDEVDALPERPKAKKNGKNITLQTNPPAQIAEENVLPKVPREVIEQMKAMHQKGVPGHGYEAVRKKYGVPYGLRFATQVQRLLEEYDKRTKEELHAIT